MPVDVNQVAEPSAATQEANGWDENGKPIVIKAPEQPKKSEEPAASETPASKAKPEEKVAEPGTAKQETKPKGEKLSAAERISQLTAERKAAEDRANDLDKRLKELEAKSAPKAAEQPKPKEAPKRPNPFTWTGTQEEFDKAMDEYEAHRDSLAAQRTRQELAQTEAQKAMSEVVKQTTEKHPDAAEKIRTATTEVMAEKTPFFVKAFINDSEVLGELLYTLADKTTLDNLLETAKANPGKALRVLRDMELDITKALSTPVVTKPEEKPSETKPRAPKPPSEVGGRGAATENATTAAAREGNFSAFDAEMRARQFKAS